MRNQEAIQMQISDGDITSVFMENYDKSDEEPTI